DYSTGWTLVRPDGSTEVIDMLPYSEPSKAGEVFYLNKQMHESDAGKTIRFLSADKNLSITLDGTVIYEFGTEDKRFFGHTPGSITNFVDLPHDIGEGMLSIMMVSPYDGYATNICQMVIGEANVVELDLIKQNLFSYFICMIILFSALMLIIMEVIEIFSKQQFSGKIYLGAICLFGAVYHAIETKTLNLFYGNQTLYSILAFVVIMVLPTLMCLYYLCNIEEKYKKRFRINFLLCVANMAFQVVVQMLNIADFMIIAPLSHAVIIITVINIDVAIIQLNVEKYRETRKLHMTLIFEMIGVTSIVIGSLIDIVRFYVAPVGDMGKYGRIGMLIFSIITLAIHIRMVSVRYVEQVNQNMEIMRLHIQEVENANKSKSLFLANMSHEIRTPMNSILGFSEILLKQDMSDEQKDYVENIRESSDNLLAIINDILDLSKIETGKMEIVENPFETKSLFQSTCKQIKSLAEKKGLEFTVDINPSLPSKFLGDEIRIREIIINILNNAIKYTPEGKVSLNVTSDEIIGDITTLIVKVSDTGIGISDKNKDLIFHAFEQVDKNKNNGIEGTGLGLSIVRNYVELMHGHIHVESELGKGSEFTIEIPLVVVDKSPLGEMSYERQGKPQSRISDLTISKNILVVDDSLVNLKVITKALEHYGIKVDSVSDGQGSIELCKNNMYDIIFMDQMMPIMDGVEAMHEIRKISGYEKGSSAKIVALTANAIKGVEEELLEEGFDGYLKKPIEFDKLEKLLMQ
ncbi:MAG: ATP-binding protein, partial [Lachnospiraceae bacterium]|nr:ATP-binding protein [Lachnospiraceae bacterium]